MPRPQRLWGRDNEIAVLDQILAGVGTGPCKVLEIAGEPGIGKTLLLTELHSRAERAGVRVAHGQVTFSPITQQFAVFVDALEELLLAEGNSVLSELDPRAALRLPDMFPVLRRAEHGDRDVLDQHYWAHRGIRLLLEGLCADAPLALFLDDVHGCQPSSVEVILELIRRPLAVPFLLVLSHRPRQSPAELLSALGTAAQRGVAYRLELDPLDVADSMRLLPTRIRPGMRRELHRRSGGNPGLLSALADLEPPSESLRNPVIAAVRLDLSKLLALGQLVAQAAAVVGDRFDSRLVAEVAQLDHDRALAGLDELIAHDLVRADGSGRMAFRDPVVRAICYHQAGGGWRLGAHHRAQRVLAARGAPAQDQARHLERAGRRMTEQDAEILRAAIDHCGDHAPEQTARWLRSLLPPAEADQRHHADLLARLAKAETLSGRLIDALATHRGAWRQREQLTQRARAELLASLLRTLRLLSRYDEAVELARQQTEIGDDALIPPATIGLAEVLLDSGDDVSIYLTPVEHVARRTSSPDRLHALAVHAAMLVRSGRPDNGLATADRIVAELAEISDADLRRTRAATITQTLDWLGQANLRAGRAAAATDLFGRGRELAQDHGQLHVLGRMHLGLAAAHHAQGELVATAEHTEDAGMLAAEIGSSALLTRTTQLCAEIEHAFLSGDAAGTGRDAPRSACAVLASLSVATGRIADGQAWRALDDRLTARCGLAERYGLTLLAVAGIGWPDDPQAAARTLRAAVAVLTLGGRAAEPMTLHRGQIPPVLDVVQSGGVPGLDVLSTRELQVAQLVAQGRTNQQIARALSLSHKTVETYLRRIFDKLEVSSRSEVAALTGVMPRSGR